MSTDIRVGDLVKATNKDRPENYAVFRVVAADSHWVENSINSFQVKSHTFEVLDRPLPPIDEELLLACRGAYTGIPAAASGPFRESWVKVINTVREYDRTHNTEESK